MTVTTEQIMQYLPLLAPLLLIQLGLMIVAIIDLIKQPALRGPKWVWVLIIVFINVLGPIAYFILGREQE